MLIYNHKKEFIGIDTIDLEKLGFSSLENLMLDVQDFADLFVKKPGFVHNFKHVNWIDFVACADSSENSKVIISANSRNFQCNLNVETIYLTQEPSSKAFLINLVNFRDLGNYETEQTSINLLESFSPDSIVKPDIETTLEPIEIFATEPLITEEVYEEIDEPIDLDISNYHEEIPDDKLNIDLSEEPQNFTQSDFTPKEIKEEHEVEEHEVYDNGYIFDPLVASSELGLPVELIEEFIEDFIAQANDFKDELYTSHNSGDSDQLKILSHKLKGVAANLRIEDALESLTTINTSDNHLKIQEELDTFYKIVSKLSGEKVQITREQKPRTPETQTQDNDIKLDFKEDTPFELKDSEVPVKIEIPELADDDFLLSIDEDEEVENFESEKIEEAFKEIEEELPKIEYDKDYVANEIGLDKDSFNELFEDYIKESQEIAKLISTATETQNTSSWKQQAFKLKGMSDNMRFFSVSKQIDILLETKNSQEAKSANNEIIQIFSQISETKA